MIILQNNKTLSSSCYCYSLSWSTIKIHHHDSACLIHARPKFSEQINIYHHQTLLGCSVDHLLSVYLSLASFVWNLNQSRTIWSAPTEKFKLLMCPFPYTLFLGPFSAKILKSRNPTLKFWTPLGKFPNLWCSFPHDSISGRAGGDDQGCRLR